MSLERGRELGTGSFGGGMWPNQALLPVKPGVPALCPLLHPNPRIQVSGSLPLQEPGVRTLRPLPSDPGIQFPRARLCSPPLWGTMSLGSHVLSIRDSDCYCPLGLPNLCLPFHCVDSTLLRASVRGIGSYLHNTPKFLPGKGLDTSSGNSGSLSVSFPSLQCL